MSKRFILCGGNVQSLQDGDLHFVSGHRLLRLYNLRREEVYIADIRRPETFHGLPKLPRLFPRRDGRYADMSNPAPGGEGGA